MAATSTKKLGRGLSALIADDYSDTPINVTDNQGNSGLKELALNVIRSGKFQPRNRFDEEYIKELATSIGKSGVMQPIVVRSVSEKNGTKYEIIAGERRWRAAKLAGEVTIPVIIKEVDDKQALELALIENIQRQNLTPLEEAAGYQRLMDEFGYTQEVMSKTIGKSRSHIANLLRLLNLPDEVKELMDKGELTMGHARALMSADDPVALAREVVARSLNVRQAETLAKEGLTPQPKPEKNTATSRQGRGVKTETPLAYSSTKSADAEALEYALSESSGLKVVIEEAGENRGRITLHYNSMEDLDRIMQAFSSMTV
jgi:ParB family chromosome partitioning protein